MAALPGREQEFRDGVDQAIVYAKAHEVPARACDGRRGAGRCRPRRGERAYVANLRQAADRLAADGIRALIEPINTRDIPGYFLNTHEQAMSIIEAGGPPQPEIAARPLSRADHGGRSRRAHRALAGRYPHVQIAGNPGRHEPDVGEINYPYLFDLFDELGYAGWIGCEYRPQGETLDRPRLGQALRHRRLSVHSSSTLIVMPAQAGIQGNALSLALDPRFRGGDNRRWMSMGS